MAPGPVFVGVEKPMKVYSFDNILFTSAKAKDDFVYKFLDTLEKNQPDLIAVQPVLREFSAPAGYKKYDVPYHPGALKYFKERNLQPRTSCERGSFDRHRAPRNASSPTRRSSPPPPRARPSSRPMSCRPR